MAPESSPPCLIQLLKRPVFFFQPFPECILARFAMARSIREISSQFIGYMPEDHILFLSECSGKSLIYGSCFPSHHRRCITEIMAFPRKIAGAVFTHLHYLRILLSQPVRHCARRRRKNNLYSRTPEIIDDLLQPAEVIYPLFRFKHSPGEYPQCHAVDARLFHQPDIFL